MSATKRQNARTRRRNKRRAERDQGAADMMLHGWVVCRHLNNTQFALHSDQGWLVWTPHLPVEHYTTTGKGWWVECSWRELPGGAFNALYNSSKKW